MLKDSSIPGGVLIWTVENNSNQEYYVSLTFTFASGNGISTYSTGEYNIYFNTKYYILQLFIKSLVILKYIEEKSIDF